MRNLFVKVSEILQSIEREKGEFLIKCLVSRETDEPYWDLILSAHWFSQNPQAAMSYLTDRIMKGLDYDCLMIFSGIIPYPADTLNPLAQRLMQIQRNHREHRYESMRLDGIVMIQTQLEQARLVVPIDDDTRVQREAA